MLLIALLSVSCKTTKTTIDAEQQAETRIEAVSQATMERTTDSTTQVQTTQTTHAADHCDELVVETQWSAPDSAGHQYATRTVQTIRRTASTTDSEWQQLMNSHAVIAEEARITDSIAAASQMHATQHTDSSVSVSTPAWVNLLVIAIVAAALVVVILFLKKWRII